MNDDEIIRNLERKENIRRERILYYDEKYHNHDNPAGHHILGTEIGRDLRNFILSNTTASDEYLTTPNLDTKISNWLWEGYRPGCFGESHGYICVRSSDLLIGRNYKIEKGCYPFYLRETWIGCVYMTYNLSKALFHSDIKIKTHFVPIELLIRTTDSADPEREDFDE